jgi:trans-aconitate 2-methyltransferase
MIYRNNVSGPVQGHETLENKVPKWDAKLYLKYEDERTRPARDLLAQVPIAEASLVFDLGCGPGNSTELLAAPFPHAEILGIDSSAEMLERARRVLPNVSFELADLRTWRPKRRADLIFANAVFQWVPGHLSVLRSSKLRLPAALSPCRSPTISLRRRRSSSVRLPRAAHGPESSRPRKERKILPPPAVYYELLRPLCEHIDIWHTIYQHVLADAPAIVEWMMGTGLRPHLALLNESERQAFLAAYTQGISRAYPALADGRVLLPFPRLFVVAVRASSRASNRAGASCIAARSGLGMLDFSRGSTAYE